MLRPSVVQGDKCLADICRPVALPHGDGSLSVLQPLSDADKSCCLMTVQSDDDGEQQCQLLQVCEDKSDTQVRWAPVWHATTRPNSGYFAQCRPGVHAEHAAVEQMRAARSAHD